MRSILKRFILNARMRFSVSAVGIQLSHTQGRMDTASALSSLSFVWKLMCLLFQVISSFDIVDMATAILVSISFVEVPSFLKVTLDI